MRFIESIIRGPPAPATEDDPTSSLSNKAIILMPVSSASAASVEVATSALVEQNTLTRLSRRPQLINSLSAPVMAPGCVSQSYSGPANKNVSRAPLAAGSSRCLSSRCLGDTVFGLCV